MNTINESHVKQPTDSEILTNFIHELNITRRHLQTYPLGHPMIDGAINKVLELIDPLFERHNSISFGVAKESLLFDQQWLDKNNRSIKDFSQALTDLDVAAIHFRERPSQSELLKLAELVNTDRQTIVQQGGLEAFLEQLQLSQTDITPVDYKAFQTTELEPEEQEKLAASLWEDFLSCLLDDSLSKQQGATTLANLDPKAIAEFLNRNYAIA